MGSSDNVERQLAAEQRGWQFEQLGAAPRGGAPPTEGGRIIAVQATLMDADEEKLIGTPFIGEGDDPLGSLLDQVEGFDREHRRL